MFNVLEMDVELEFIQSVLFNGHVTGDFPMLYKGKLNHEMIRIFTDIAEEKMKSQDIHFNTIRRTYHILVESLQNIIRHSESFDKDDAETGIFLFTEDETHFFIVTGNKMPNDKIEGLKNKMVEINSQSAAELREYRRIQMRDGEWSEKGGAGLGLIDMARKAGEKLVYEFMEINKDYSYFFLKVSVKKEM